MPHDRYGTDVLSGDWRAPKKGRAVDVPTELGMVVEEVTTDWCGEVVGGGGDIDTHTQRDRPAGRGAVPPRAPPRSAGSSGW